MTPRRIGLAVFGFLLLIVCVWLPFELLVTVGADEIVIKQGVFDGKLTVWNQPGLQWQNFGKTTRYKKSGQFWFSTKKDEGKEKDESIRVRFNDGGHGNISGSLSFDLPVDEAAMIKLHSVYSSEEGIELRLIRQAVTKSVYMTGPLMSSKESSGERRADLINYISEQITRGVYKTETFEHEVPDVLAGEIETVEFIDVPDLDEKGKPKLDKEGKPLLRKEPKTVKKPRMKKVAIVRPKTNDKGVIEVQESSALTDFGVRTYNLTINTITYEEQVEKQIQAQQQATMAIQTAMAKAKEAEQKRLTVEKEGEAEAAKAKWEQEVKKATAVTEAQQKKEVATMALDTARLEAQAVVERGKGEAEARKLIMTADGALDKKIAAWVEVQKAYAAEMGKQSWVPQIVMGGGPGATAPATDFMQFLQMRAARELALDLRVGKAP
jgi:hypothetical protein